MKVISNIISIPNREIELRHGNHCSEAIFRNGSIIKIIGASDNARGHRFNGCIVDYEINKKVVDYVVMPSLVPVCDDDGGRSKIDKPEARMRFSEISSDDVIKSEQYKQILYVSSANRYKSYNPDDMYIDFRREYNMEFFEKYSRPIIEKELNGDKVFFYAAHGIPKENITYEIEFINKTKQTFLNIGGRNEIKDLGFESEINVHMLINTDIYDGFRVQIHDGIVKVILNEIKNEAPTLKDMSM